MSTLELLREAYARDVIGIEVFERLVGAVVAGHGVALPIEVQKLAPAPARILLRAAGAPRTRPSAANLDAVLKTMWARS